MKSMTNKINIDIDENKEERKNTIKERNKESKTIILDRGIQRKTIDKKSIRKVINKKKKRNYNQNDSKKIKPKEDKEINQNSNSIKLKEKNLILKKKFYQKNKIFNDNNETNSNLNTSRFKGIKTDRNNSREKLNKKVSFFQIFKNNIKNFNKIKFNVFPSQKSFKRRTRFFSEIIRESGTLYRYGKNNT